MITKSKRVISVILAVIIISSAIGLNSFALTADSEWTEYYNKYMADGSAVYMNPGSDETQRNFSWYSSAYAGKSRIEISETEDFATFNTFNCTSITTPEFDRANKVTVKNLEPGKTYYYRCFNGDTLIESSFFKTIAGNDFTAVYMTDIHITNDEDDLENSLLHQSYTLNEVLKKANEKSDFDLILSAGDQASYGARDEYESLVASPYFRNVPISLCVGNHDRKGIAYKYFNNNPNKYEDGTSSFIGNDYWYVKGNVLFLVYDSNNEAAITHRNFTKEAIEANPDVKWKVAVMHHDLYGRLTEKREDDANENRRPVFIPIFDEYGIDIVFLGHSHYYSVSNVLYDGNIVGEFDDNNTVTDAKGTVYIVSNSINHPRSVEAAEEITPQVQNAVAIQKDGPVYNIVDFSNDSIKVKSYALDEDEPFYSFTIEKTTDNGGHIVQDEVAPNSITQIVKEVVAFFTEIFETIGKIWDNYFD